MPTLSEIKAILENQQEVKNLAYFCYLNERTGQVLLNLSVLENNKEVKYKSVDRCLECLYDILRELGRKQKWGLKRNT